MSIQDLPMQFIGRSSLLWGPTQTEGSSMKYPIKYVNAIFSLIFILAFTAQTTLAQDKVSEAHLRQLNGKLRAEIEKISSDLNGVLGVAIKDLTSGEEILLNENLLFPTGSSIKIPILIELYRQAAEGRYQLSDQKWIERKDKVAGSGIIQLFNDHSSQLSLADLGILMIALSDNTATNMLIDQVGMTNVNSTLDKSGLPRIRLRRKMIDQAASARGDENTASPYEAMRLMEKLHRGEIVGRSLSDQVLTTLKIRKNSAIPSLIPPTVAIANKPGGIEGASCDWAIVYVPNRPFAISVMTAWLGEDALSSIAKIARLAYDHYAKLSRSTVYGARVDKK